MATVAISALLCVVFGLVLTCPWVSFSFLLPCLEYYHRTSRRSAPSASLALLRRRTLCLRASGSASFAAVRLLPSTYPPPPIAHRASFRPCPGLLEMARSCPGAQGRHDRQPGHRYAYPHPQLPAPGHGRDAAKRERPPWHGWLLLLLLLPCLLLNGSWLPANGIHSKHLSWRFFCAVRRAPTRWKARRRRI